MSYTINKHYALAISATPRPSRQKQLSNNGAFAELLVTMVFRAASAAPIFIINATSEAFHGRISVTDEDGCLSFIESFPQSDAINSRYLRKVLQ